MGIRWKKCWDCGQEKRMGKTKKRCASCRKANPNKQRPAKAHSPKTTKKQAEQWEFIRSLEAKNCTAEEIKAEVKRWKQQRRSAQQAQDQQKGKRKKKAAKRQETYNDRNLVLKELGFNSYADYRDSELWASIRRRAFAKHGSTCLLCKQQADVLHHFSYRKEVLEGKQLDKLKPLCDECHHKVEFDEKDNKRTLLDSQNTFLVLLEKAAY